MAHPTVDGVAFAATYLGASAWLECVEANATRSDMPPRAGGTAGGGGWRGVVSW